MVRVTTARDVREQNSSGAELYTILFTESCLPMGPTRRCVPEVDLGSAGGTPLTCFPPGFDFLSETVEIGGGAKGPRPLAGTRGVLALYSTDFTRASCSRSASWVNAMARRTV